MSTRLQKRIDESKPSGLTRAELLSRTGNNRIVEPTIVDSFKWYEDREWREDRGNSPHGWPWHTSFHASSFPGNDERACGRKAIYTLMNIPRKEATPRKLRGQAEMGNAIEEMLVKRWGNYGMLLSNDKTGDDEFQTGFTDEEHMLTGSVDAVLVPDGWRRPHVVEVKSKAHDVVKEMIALRRGPDDAHVRQCQTYISFAHELGPQMWPEYEACIDGTVLYCSRDDPSLTYEFFFSYDPRFMKAGRAKLQLWKDFYVNGELPPHPFGGKEWSQMPCQYCDFKKNTCKPDALDEVTVLRESHGIAFAEEVRGKYDYKETREAVLNRWGLEDKEENE